MIFTPCIVLSSSCPVLFIISAASCRVHHEQYRAGLPYCFDICTACRIAVRYRYMAQDSHKGTPFSIRLRRTAESGDERHKKGCSRTRRFFSPSAASGNPAPWHPPAFAGGGKRSLARDTNVSRMREFAVPPGTPCIRTRKRRVQAGGRVNFESRQVGMPEGAPLSRSSGELSFLPTLSN